MPSATIAFAWCLKLSSFQQNYNSDLEYETDMFMVVLRLPTSGVLLQICDRFSLIYAIFYHWFCSSAEYRIHCRRTQILLLGNTMLKVVH